MFWLSYESFSILCDVFFFAKKGHFQLIMLCQYAKNQAISSRYSRDIFEFKIQQSDWSRAFWAISEESDFFQI